MNPFRLRCKVLRQDDKQFLVPLAIRVSHDTMVTVGMNEEKTVQLTLSIDEYNALPYHWFEDQGEAPKREEPWKG